MIRYFCTSGGIFSKWKVITVLGIFSNRLKYSNELAYSWMVLTCLEHVVYFVTCFYPYHMVSCSLSRNLVICERPNLANLPADLFPIQNIGIISEKISLARISIHIFTARATQDYVTHRWIFHRVGELVSPPFIDFFFQVSRFYREPFIAKLFFFSAPHRLMHDAALLWRFRFTLKISQVRSNRTGA